MIRIYLRGSFASRWGFTGKVQEILGITRLPPGLYEDPTRLFLGWSDFIGLPPPPRNQEGTKEPLALSCALPPLRQGPPICRRLLVVQQYDQLFCVGVKTRPDGSTKSHLLEDGEVVFKVYSDIG